MTPVILITADSEVSYPSVQIGGEIHYVEHAALYSAVKST